MLDLDDIADVVAGAVREATAPLLARIEVLEKREPAAPEKGEPGKAGEPGEPGAPGKDGNPGKDGVGLADALIDKDGHLVLTMTDGRTKSLGLVVGRDGEPGRDGADGLGPEDLKVARVGERTIEIALVRGDIEHAFEVEFPVPIYRGVFKDGQPYERGDLATWAGSLWHCDKATSEKPGTADWTLAAKRGRDAKAKA